MSLVLLALLFMLRERRSYHSDFHLLSCQDIVELLNVYLPRADATEQAVLRHMRIRHRKRQAAIDSAQRKYELTKIKER